MITHQLRSLDDALQIPEFIEHERIRLSLFRLLLCLRCGTCGAGIARALYHLGAHLSCKTGYDIIDHAHDILGIDL